MAASVRCLCTHDNGIKERGQLRSPEQFMTSPTIYNTGDDFTGICSQTLQSPTPSCVTDFYV